MTEGSSVRKALGPERFFRMRASVWTESVCDQGAAKACLELSQVPDSATEIWVELVQVETAQTAVGK